MYISIKLSNEANYNSIASFLLYTNRKIHMGYTIANWVEAKTWKTAKKP